MDDIFTILEPKKPNVEDIFTDDELDAIFESYYNMTGDTNLENVATVLKQAAAIRRCNQFVEDAIKGRVGLSLEKGCLSFAPILEL